MDINKEVAKFDKEKLKLDEKRVKLVESFAAKIHGFIYGKVMDNERIEKTREALAEQEALNDQAIDQAYNVLKETK